MSREFRIRSVGSSNKNNNSHHFDEFVFLFLEIAGKNRVFSFKIKIRKPFSCQYSTDSSYFSYKMFIHQQSKHYLYNMKSEIEMISLNYSIASTLEMRIVAKFQREINQIYQTI